MTIETILAVLIPSIVASAFIIRYFWNKDKCLTLAMQRLDKQEKSEEKSHDTHGELYNKINDLGNRTTALEVKVDLIITHFKIPTK